MKWHSVAVVTAVMTAVAICATVVGIGTSSLFQSREGGGRRQPLGIHHNASRSLRLLAGEGTLQVHRSLCHCRLQPPAAHSHRTCRCARVCACLQCATSCLDPSHEDMRKLVFCSVAQTYTACPERKRDRLISSPAATQVVYCTVLYTQHKPCEQGNDTSVGVWQLRMRLRTCGPCTRTASMIAQNVKRFDRH